MSLRQVEAVEADCYKIGSILSKSGSLNRCLQSVCSANVLCGFEGESTGAVDMAQAATPEPPMLRLLVAPVEVVQALRLSINTDC